jgi:membrane dipeptidase
MLLGTATAIVAPFSALSARSREWFESAIIIDALGSVRDPYSVTGVPRLSDRAWTETLATGVTMVRDTVTPVGDVVDAWGEYLRGLANKQARIAANPDACFWCATLRIFSERNARGS